MATGVHFESEQGWRESRFEDLEHENEKLKDENEKLKDENDQLRQTLRKVESQSEEKNSRIKELENKEVSYQGRIKKYRNYLIAMKKRQEEQKELYEGRIEISLERGEICDNSCVLDTMCWIWGEKLPSLTVKCACGHFNCRRKLEKILIYNAHEEIGKEDLDCPKLMYILEKNNIVQQVGEDFDYPKDMDAENRDKIIHDAWQKIVEEKQNNTRVLILGKKWDGEEVGHVEVCDLEATPKNESTVVVYDVQKPKVRTMNEEKFKTDVIDGIQLQLYTVNFNLFTEIIKRYYDTTDCTLNENAHAVEALDLHD